MFGTNLAKVSSDRGLTTRPGTPLASSDGRTRDNSPEPANYAELRFGSGMPTVRPTVYLSKKDFKLSRTISPGPTDTFRELVHVNVLHNVSVIRKAYDRQPFAGNSR